MRLHNVHIVLEYTPLFTLSVFTLLTVVTLETFALPNIEPTTHHHPIISLKLTTTGVQLNGHHMPIDTLPLVAFLLRLINKQRINCLFDYGKNELKEL